PCAPVRWCREDSARRRASRPAPWRLRRWLSRAGRPWVPCSVAKAMETSQTWNSACSETRSPLREAVSLESAPKPRGYANAKRRRNNRPRARRRWFRHYRGLAAPATQTVGAWKLLEWRNSGRRKQLLFSFPAAPQHTATTSPDTCHGDFFFAPGRQPISRTQTGPHTALPPLLSSLFQNQLSTCFETAAQCQQHLKQVELRLSWVVRSHSVDMRASHGQLHDRYRKIHEATVRRTRCRRFQREPQPKLYLLHR